LAQRDHDVVLIDLDYARDTTSGEEGLALLQQIHEAAVRRRSPRLHGSPPRRQKNRSAFG
jgi:hypothetical protein